MRHRFVRYFLSLLMCLSLSGFGTASVAKPFKIGMILPMSGPFAAYGKQILNGAKLYQDIHGDSAAGRTVQIVVKDDTGIAPELSKRHAQELIIRDKVDVLAGFGLTPSAFAVAPLATQAKTPMIVMNAATSSITTKSPYIVRVSQTLPQVTAPVAHWAAENDIDTVTTLVADYGPGHDAEQQFIKTFTAGGGKILDSIRMPVSNPDFSSYLQRAKDTQPDAVFLFVPSGEQGVSFLKGFQERGLADAGIRLIATGDLTDEDVLDAMGEPAMGVITSFHYSDVHDSPENDAYTTAYAQAYAGERPNFMSVAGYDGLHLVYQILDATEGVLDGNTFIDTAKGLRWTSPRGPVEIDPETRDIIQTIYMREVEREGDRLVNREFDTLPAFKDPGKAP